MLSLALVIGFTICHGAEIKPASHYFKICNEKTLDAMDSCIKTSINQVKSLLIKGIPELGVTPIEPMIVERMEWTEGGQDNFKYKLTLINLKIHGMRTYEATVVKSNFKNLTIITTFFNKQFDFEGDFELKGKLLVLPLNSKGFATFNISDVRLHFVTVLEKYNKKGVEYVRVKSNKLTLEPQFVRVYFSNLFGDKTLDDNANKSINDNWKVVFQLVKPLAEEAFAKLIVSDMNKIYGAFPFEKLYPSGNELAKQS